MAVLMQTVISRRFQAAFLSLEPYMNKNLRARLARKASHVAAMRAITDRAASEQRDLSAEEISQFDSLTAQLDSPNAAMTREQLRIDGR